MLGTTFGGNHLACAAALAVLDVIEQEQLIENAATVGTYLIEELKKFPQIKEVRGEGLMIGMEFETTYKIAERTKSIHWGKWYKCYSPPATSLPQYGRSNRVSEPIKENTLVLYY